MRTSSFSASADIVNIGNEPSLVSASLFGNEAGAYVKGKFYDAGGNEIRIGGISQFTFIVAVETEMSLQQLFDTEASIDEWPDNAVSFIGEVTHGSFYLQYNSEILTAASFSVPQGSGDPPEFYNRLYTRGMRVCIGACALSTLMQNDFYARNTDEFLPLKYYCLVGSTAAISVAIRLSDIRNKVLETRTITVGTTAKSLEKFFLEASPNTWPQEAIYAKIISISAGSVYVNTAGNGVAATNDGVDATNTPTTANADQLVVGSIIGGF